jgi:hypothetical protein
MFGRGIAALAVVGAVALTATAVGIDEHPAFVTVVVDFNGKVPANQVEFGGLTKTMATLRIAHPGITTLPTGDSGDGVRVALQPGAQALHITASFAPGRFKYASYGVILKGKRLSIALWKSAPPPAGGARGYRDCLSIRTWHVSKGSVSASGTERGVFENTFQVVVRGANGKVLGKRTITRGPSWSTNVKYKASHRQAGTLEAVAFSPKDGALACLYETRVTLPAS